MLRVHENLPVAMDVALIKNEVVSRRLHDPPRIWRPAFDALGFEISASLHSQHAGAFTIPYLGQLPDSLEPSG